MIFGPKTWWFLVGKTVDLNGKHVRFVRCGGKNHGKHMGCRGKTMDCNGEEPDISREIVILLAVLVKTIGF